MALNRNRKLAEAIRDLSRCLEAYEPSIDKDRSLSFIAATKAFEVCLEYAWKELKREVEDRGLEANSPKDAVRGAAEVGIVQDPTLWIHAINARNQSVHDYFSLTEEEFIKLISLFGHSVKELL